MIYETIHKPFVYGRKLLKDMGKENEAYIDELEILDFFGYKVEFDDFNSNSSGDTTSIFESEELCILLPGENKILLSDALVFKPERKRMTLFHEIGHIIIPHHQKYYLSTSTENRSDPLPKISKKIEREAFEAGVELLFPLKFFVEDSQGLPSNFESIKKIAEKYKASFEATCIRYAQTHQGKVGIMVVTRNDDRKDSFAINQNEKEPFLSDSFENQDTINQARDFLKVKYCSRSKLFSNFIKANTEIKDGSLIHECYQKKETVTGEMHASTFGSLKNIVYKVECCYHNSNVFILLKLEDSQIYFIKEFLK